jgi:hypothetical protein
MHKWYSENRVNGSFGRTDPGLEDRRGQKEALSNAEVHMRTLLCCVLSLSGPLAFSAESLRVGVVVFEGFLSSEVVAPDGGVREGDE